ncbi:ATP-grasp fold amidoligase family protein [Lichenicoccus sp.]|uniref:ATP-grasp fold amidoligase family protein n=1 Tax=Lichenicoccus sp. TaxID=2781899 RepID=UPI003D0D6CAE
MSKRSVTSTRHPALRQALDWTVARVPRLQRLQTRRRLLARMHQALGYRPNLRNPRTFNEKIAWRMLHDRNPLIPLTTDKIAVRNWVAARLGQEVLVPLLGVWDYAADIPWDALPSSFVLKASHGWNMNLLVRDKRTVDRASALATADQWLRTSHDAETGEWGYRSVPHRLLAETLLVDEAGDVPADIKLHVFGGRMRMFEVHSGRFDDHRSAYFGTAMQRLPFTHFLPPDHDWTPPPNIAELIRIAECLGAPFDYVRVDLYAIGGVAYFGELTHYQGSACIAFVPPEYDRIVGDMWELPKTRHR